jgi:hypothetical protein
MAMLRVTGFQATAEIRGTVKNVGYDGAIRRLWIDALDADEAVVLIAALGGAPGHVVGAMPQGEQEVVMAAAAPAAAARAMAVLHTGEPKVETVVVPAAVPASATPPAPAEQPSAAEVKSARKPPARRRGAGTAATVQDDVGAMAKSEPEPADDFSLSASPVVEQPAPPPVHSDPAPAPAPAPAVPVAAPSTGGVPRELTEAKKIRDVVAYFYDSGIRDPEEIVRRCLEVKDDIQVLARIRNADERVRRAITVMGLDA